jgi:hypothetical protein
MKRLKLLAPLLQLNQFCLFILSQIMPECKSDELELSGAWNPFISVEKTDLQR